MYKICCFVIAVCLLSACSLHKQPEASNQEKYRPQVHFSPTNNWMNGSFGLVYFEGEYHLFYPYNPDGMASIATCWGHAISSDMVHWEHLPIALYPDELGSITAGSVVVDLKNTTGFGSVDNPPLVAIFTYHNYEKEEQGKLYVKAQGIAYSLDKGRTWTTYDQNPVIPNPKLLNFNDPKVFWYEPAQQWVMVLAVTDQIRFYTSDNLKDWTFASDYEIEAADEGEQGESPDLFELPVTNTDETQWVFLVSSNYGNRGDWKTRYIVGNFDGKTFTSPQKALFWMDFGKANYAGTTFNNMPDNQRVLIGWMNNWEYATKAPTQTWRGATTIPRALSLSKVQDYYILASQPVKEIETLYGDKKTFQNIDVAQKGGDFEGVANISADIPFPLLPTEITVRFKSDTRGQIGFAEKFGIKLSNKQGEYIKIGYDNFHNGFYVDRENSRKDNFSEAFPILQFLSYDVEDSPFVDMRIILDVASLELFGMKGKPVITDTFFPTSDFDNIEIFTENGRIVAESLSVTQLKSIWEKD